MHSFSKIFLLMLLLGACTAPGQVLSGTAAQRAFLDHLGKLCGASFAGTASIVPADASDTWSGTPIVARVARCTRNEVHVPVQVGSERSRTWIFRQSEGGLVLVHDHRHADGSPAAQTMYGGPASSEGSAHAQHFRADAYTAGLLPASAANVWHVTLTPDGSSLTYFLERKGVPRLKAELVRQK